MMTFHSPSFICGAAVMLLLSLAQMQIAAYGRRYRARKAAENASKATYGPRPKSHDLGPAPDRVVFEIKPHDPAFAGLPVAKELLTTLVEWEPMSVLMKRVHIRQWVTNERLSLAHLYPRNPDDPVEVVTLAKVAMKDARNRANVPGSEWAAFQKCFRFTIRDRAGIFALEPSGNEGTIWPASHHIIIPGTISPYVPLNHPVHADHSL